MIPEEHYPAIIERCYWPILALAEGGVPVGVEMSGVTLREINRLDPAFVEKLKALWGEGRCEFIGSGFSQAVYPLIPAEVNRWNLEAGNRVYVELLGKRPVTALVNEQTYSLGLVDLYTGAGYESIIMDWNNCLMHNDYPRRYRYFPQRAAGFESGINVIWSNSIAFQKFQRCVHSEITEQDYLEYLFLNHSPGHDRAFVLYCNDAEVFDYRPGSDVEPGGEHRFIADLLKRIDADDRVSLTLPGDIIALFKGTPDAFNEIKLESAEMPVVCKKQTKYNPVRWAVSGRDSMHINTECYKVYGKLGGLIEGAGVEEAVIEPLKEALVELWGSDFRTHTIDEKFSYFQKRLGWLKGETERLLEARLLKRAPVSIAVGEVIVSGGSPGRKDGSPGADGAYECKYTSPPNAEGEDARIEFVGNVLKVSTGTAIVDLLVNKGCALKGVTFPGVSDEPLIGTIPHGYYEDMRLGADFFSGHLIHLARGGCKTTDLGVATYDIQENDTSVTVRLKTPLDIGTLWKTYVISKEAPEVELTYRLKLNGLASSSMRLGIFTALPEAFDMDSLWYETVNGGTAPERYPLRGRTISHDEQVNASVSASGCLGATDGSVTIGDSRKCVTIHTDKSELYSVPMLRFTDLGESFFLRLYHSIGEIDDTACWTLRGYNEITFSISARKI
jgi:hypothetical protein